VGDVRKVPLLHAPFEAQVKKNQWNTFMPPASHFFLLPLMIFFPLPPLMPPLSCEID